MAHQTYTVEFYQAYLTMLVSLNYPFYTVPNTALTMNHFTWPIRYASGYIQQFHRLLVCMSQHRSFRSIGKTICQCTSFEGRYQGDIRRAISGPLAIVKTVSIGSCAVPSCSVPSREDISPTDNFGIGDRVNSTWRFMNDYFEIASI